jgi:amino-acid N-acetyltransferase
MRPVEEADRPFVEATLEGSDLPVADLEAAFDCLFVYEVDGERTGVGGVERAGEVGLLRSVAVEESARGGGHGTRLCEELLSRARADGFEELYLLTTTAESFFAEFGFRRTDRESVPAAVRETSEFEDLCPDSAVPMRCDLADAAAADDPPALDDE